MRKQRGIPTTIKPEERVRAMGNNEEMRQKFFSGASELRQIVALHPMPDDAKHIQELDEAESLIRNGHPVTWGDLNSLSLIMLGQRLLRHIDRLEKEGPGSEEEYGRTDRASNT